MMLGEQTPRRRPGLPPQLRSPLMPDTNMNVDVARFGSFRSCAVTHAGTANRLNEDAYVNRPDLGLWAVADGAGGHEIGEVASAEVVGLLDGIEPGLSAADMLHE